MSFTVLVRELVPWGLRLWASLIVYELCKYFLTLDITYGY